MRQLFFRSILLLTLCLPAGLVIADDPIDQTGSDTTNGLIPSPSAPTLDQTPQSDNQYNQMMEKCKVVDQNGNGLIKPYMADSGINLAGDANAWIWVPYGQCKKINAGDFTGISPDILAKINTTNIQQAPTLGN